MNREEELQEQVDKLQNELVELRRARYKADAEASIGKCYRESDENGVRTYIKAIRLNGDFVDTWTFRCSEAMGYEIHFDDCQLWFSKCEEISAEEFRRAWYLLIANLFTESDRVFEETDEQV